MDDKEEGEVSDGAEDSFGLSYQVVKRPDTSQYRPVSHNVPSSDESSSDSDSDSPPLATKRRRPNVTRMETSVAEESNKGAETVLPPLKPKRNNIWSTVMQEQVLSQEIGGFGLKRRLDRGDRNVESYDYLHALELRGLRPTQNDEEEEEEEEETDEKKQKRMNRKRHVRERISYPNPKNRRELKDIENDAELTDTEFGHKMAECLMERKPELIVRTIETLGRDKAIEIYKQTQEVEREGGVKIMNGSRRRTSGGVYLQFLKSFPGVGKEELSKIFPQDNQQQQQQWGRREKAHRKRERHESNPQGEGVSESGLELVRGVGAVFSEDPGGTKCPGSTPVTTPQHSDNEAEDGRPATVINQLSPSRLPELVAAATAQSCSSPPPSKDGGTPGDDAHSKEPPAKSLTLKSYNGGYLDIAPIDPRAVDLKALTDPRIVDPRALADPRAVDLRALADPRAVDPRALADPRAAEVYDEDFLEIHTNEEMELF